MCTAREASRASSSSLRRATCRSIVGWPTKMVISAIPIANPTPPRRSSRAFGVSTAGRSLGRENRRSQTSAKAKAPNAMTSTASTTQPASDPQTRRPHVSRPQSPALFQKFQTAGMATRGPNRRLPTIHSTGKDRAVRFQRCHRDQRRTGTVSTDDEAHPQQQSAQNTRPEISGRNIDQFKVQQPHGGSQVDQHHGQ